MCLVRLHLDRMPTDLEYAVVKQREMSQLSLARSGEQEEVSLRLNSSICSVLLLVSRLLTQQFRLGDFYATCEFGFLRCSHLLICSLHAG
jgi:hypothetical protein